MANPYQRGEAMTPYDGTNRHGGTPKTVTSPITEQILRGGEATRLSSHTSPTFGRYHNIEDDHGLHHKKSVLTRVKEKARKWRNTLSKKKHNQDGNSTPLWGVSLEDDEEDDDPEYFGAPMYESEMAPEECKETARQHPSAGPVISEKHVLPSSVNASTEQKSPTANKSMAENESKNQGNEWSPKALIGSVSEKLAPAYASVSDATHAIAAKIQSLTVSGTPEPSSAPVAVNPPAKASGTFNPSAQSPLAMEQTSPTANGSGIRDVPAPAPAAATVGSTGGVTLGSSDRTWDKGVSVTEYFMHKLEPGEDERALSQVISQAISPNKNPGDGRVMEKVKEVVSSLLHNEESQHAPSKLDDKKPSSQIPISSNSQEVIEEEDSGRVLQAN